MISESGFWTDSNPIDFYDDLGLLEGLKNFLKKSNSMNIVDFGCGNAFYAKELIKEGFSCSPYDGNPNTPKITNGLADILDLSNNFDLGKKFDCVVSLEVGEHIPEEFESTYIKNLTKHSKSFIILSWAVVGQPGTEHVNCKNNDYIIQKMSEENFKYLENESLSLRDNCHMFWFKNTIMIFEKSIDESFIISVKKEDYNNDKRRSNVLRNIIPKISEIMNVSVFDAIRPEDIEVIENKVFYKGFISIKRGLDKNSNSPTSLKNCSLTIGHYRLFQYSVLNNTGLLIFEDDAIVDHLDLLDLKNNIREFKKIDEPSILYLQSECPWGNNPYPLIDGRHIRQIPSNYISEVPNLNLLKIDKSWFDIAGTTCYYINPLAASVIIDVINKFGLLNIDQITQLCLKLDEVKFYLPKNYKKMIFLL